MNTAKNMETPNNRLTTSYLLWCSMFLGLGGLHRLYNGKIATGVLWMLTGGMFGIGQFVDLFLMPNMVEEHDLKLRAKYGLSPAGVPLTQPAAVTQVHSPKEKLMIRLLKAAESKGGKLTVTQGVMATEASFAEVESVLQEMHKSGYARIDNDPHNGAVTYHFNEL